MESTSGVNPPAVAVYCASLIGTRKAYQLAAISLGKALAASSRGLVYGGGSKGIMGLVSGAVLEGGGDVTGVVPVAMVAAGGEGNTSGAGGSSKEDKVNVILNEKGREKVHTILVESMHERKVEMAKRVGGFVGLSGGFGTFEEILEVITWSQLGIHSKPVVILNVLSFYDPLRDLIRTSIREGFIDPKNERLVVFVDGPSRPTSTSESGTEKEWMESHESFDWGQAALEALDGWDAAGAWKYSYDWTRRLPQAGSDGKDDSALAMT